MNSPTYHPMKHTDSPHSLASEHVACQGSFLTPLLPLSCPSSPSAAFGTISCRSPCGVVRAPPESTLSTESISCSSAVSSFWEPFERKQTEEKWSHKTTIGCSLFQSHHHLWAFPHFHRSDWKECSPNHQRSQLIAPFRGHPDFHE